MHRMRCSRCACSHRSSGVPAASLAVFSYDETGVGGCLMAGDDVPEPSAAGTLIYLDAVLARVAGAGGRITTPEVQLPEGMG